MSGKIDEQKGNSDIKQMQAMKNLVAKYSNFAEIPEATKTAPTLLTVVSIPDKLFSCVDADMPFLDRC
jgi:nitrogen fixation/metabolism regulation signal transduction histidine kinase